MSFLYGSREGVYSVYLCVDERLAGLPRKSFALSSPGLGLSGCPCRVAGPCTNGMVCTYNRYRYRPT